VALAHALGLKVVAEGVETEAQLEFLQTCRCDFLQGFLAGKPVDADTAAKEYVEFRSRPASRSGLLDDPAR